MATSTSDAARSESTSPFSSSQGAASTQGAAVRASSGSRKARIPTRFPRTSTVRAGTLSPSGSV